MSTRDSLQRDLAACYQRAVDSDQSAAAQRSKLLTAKFEADSRLQRTESARQELEQQLATHAEREKQLSQSWEQDRVRLQSALDDTTRQLQALQARATQLNASYQALLAEHALCEPKRVQLAAELRSAQSSVEQHEQRHGEAQRVAGLQSAVHTQLMARVTGVFTSFNPNPL
jgi:chromosome segregation ATPase